MSRFLPRISSRLREQLQETLQFTDEIAFFNVTHDDESRSILNAQGEPIPKRFPRGGPFGAALAVSYGDRLEIIGDARGNNVIGSGIASAHAEDQALQPDNYQVLVEKLTAFQKASQEVTVWMLSSGQSCTTCHTKQEIMARDLLARGLIQQGGFAALYGATYDDTFRIAHFYDAQYADAMILFARDPGNKENLIRASKTDFNQVPQDVRDVLASARAATAVIVREGSVYAIGDDARSEINLNATAEVSAVRKACKKYRDEENILESWGVDGELYTTSSEIGPLLFAEMGWTGINKVHHVAMPQGLQHLQFDARETPALGNADFLRIIAGGYHDAGAAITVLRDESFVNNSQPMWARVWKANDNFAYNGSSVSDAVLAERDVRTRFLFAAHDVTDTALSRPPVPLASLADFMPG